MDKQDQSEGWEWKEFKWKTKQQRYIKKSLNRMKK